MILGSASPRRRELFNFFSIPYEPASPPFDESSVPFQGEPENYVCKLSLGKGQSLLPFYPNTTILTADTIVYYNGKIYGKPKDQEEAFQMLREFSGQWHTVYTGLTLYHSHPQTLNKKMHKSASEFTRVLFNPLTDDQILTCLNRFEWSDKAGAYSIQEGGRLMIEKIEGCYYNVMGLPINTLRTLFSSIGIDLWQYIR